jgi:hypothetical protein
MTSLCERECSAQTTNTAPHDDDIEGKGGPAMTIEGLGVRRGFRTGGGHGGRWLRVIVSILEIDVFKCFPAGQKTE